MFTSKKKRDLKELVKQKSVFVVDVRIYDSRICFTESSTELLLMTLICSTKLFTRVFFVLWFLKLLQLKVKKLEEESNSGEKPDL